MIDSRYSGERQLASRLKGPIPLVTQRNSAAIVNVNPRYPSDGLQTPDLSGPPMSIVTHPNRVNAT